jgi:type IV secretion system protein VirD4
VLAAIWGATQWTAWRLGYHPQLGTAWTEIAGIPVYPALAFFLFPTSQEACTGGPMSDGAASMMLPKSDQPLA